MRVRDLQPSDIPILKHYAETSGFPYPRFDDSHIEAFLVVADEEDLPIVAIAAKRLVEVFGWFSPTAGAELRIEALRAVYGPMAETLLGLGYDCAEVFIPPQLERRGFGRFLRDQLGWHKNWSSWGKRLR